MSNGLSVGQSIEICITIINCVVTNLCDLLIYTYCHSLKNYKTGKIISVD